MTKRGCGKGVDHRGHTIDSQCRDGSNAMSIESSHHHLIDKLVFEINLDELRTDRNRLAKGLFGSIKALA